MKVGLYLATQFTPQTPLGPRLDDLIEQVRVARASGFTSLWGAQHFVTAPMQMFQIMPLLARLSGEAKGMQVGTNILVFPLLNPVLVAEEAATLDWFTDGNFVLGVGIGYRPEEFPAMGGRLNERVGRLEEGLGIVRRFWREDRVTHKGKYHAFDNVGLSLKPKRPGGPPIWIAAVVEPAIKRAAVLGDEWLITFYPTITAVGEQLALYRATRAAAGLPPAVDYPLCRECYVGASNATAAAECGAQIQYKYGAYAAWGQDKILGQEDRFDQPFEQFRRDRFIIGDEQAVADDLARYRDQLGVNHFIMRMQWPGLDQALVLKSIERLGRIVAKL